MLANRERFALSLRRLAQYHGRDLNASDIGTYWDLLSPRLDDEAFHAACAALQTGDWWPTPARILRAATATAEFQHREAVARLYDRIRACDEPGPTGGSCYRYETIKQRCGEVAVRLFRAVGGPSAFLRALRYPDDEFWLRKEFVEAAHDLAVSQPESMRMMAASVAGSLPGHGRRALPAPEEVARAT